MSLPPPRGRRADSRAGRFAPLVAIILALAIAPLSLRAVNNALQMRGQNRSYLPSLENRATRKGFRTRRSERLRYGNPEWVFIGDSMLGTRIEPQLLGELSGTGKRNVQFLFQAASGPAWWYLSFKNHLVPSGVKPRVDVLLLPRHQHDGHDVPSAEPARGSARRGGRATASRRSTPSSPRAQRGVWSARRSRAQPRLRGRHRPTRGCIPTIRRWYALLEVPGRWTRGCTSRTSIEEDFNQNFRRDLAADIGAAEDDADFERDLPIVRAAAHHGAVAGAPAAGLLRARAAAARSATSRRRSRRRCGKYVADFRAWAESAGRVPSTTTPATPR